MIDPSPPAGYEHEAGDYFTWALVAALGLLGPILAHAARDDEMYIFGLSLFAFAAVFLFAELKRHFDSIEAAPRIVEAAHE